MAEEGFAPYWSVEETLDMQMSVIGQGYAGFEVSQNYILPFHLAFPDYSNETRYVSYGLIVSKITSGLFFLL